MRELGREGVDVAGSEEDLVSGGVDGGLGTPYACPRPTAPKGRKGGDVPFEFELGCGAGEGQGDEVS